MPGESSQHLTAAVVAAYVDKQLSGTELDRIEQHLADCRECRSEVVAVGRVIRKLRRPKPWAVAAPLAAAAVLVLLVGPWHPWSPDKPVFREPALTTIVAPTPLAPRGHVAEVPFITWSSVPRASRYEVTILDTAGTIVWETRVADSVARVPPTVSLAAGKPYFWKVAARTETNRWVTSDLTRFTIGPTVAP